MNAIGVFFKIFAMRQSLVIQLFFISLKTECPLLNQFQATYIILAIYQFLIPATHFRHQILIVWLYVVIKLRG